LQWTDSDGKTAESLLFHTESSPCSVTKKTSFANMRWLGDDARPFVAVDTPGQDDTHGASLDSQACRDHLAQLAADMHNKLKALGHIHLIVILHNDVAANRLNPATYMVLRMLDEIFAEAKEPVWDHVVIAYSKCNDFDFSWRAGLESKKQQLQTAITNAFPRCGVSVPVIALGGCILKTSQPSEAALGSTRRRKSVSADQRSSQRRSRSRSRSPIRASLGGPSASPSSAETREGFEVLWQHLDSKPRLDTSKLKPFNGPYKQWQALIDEKDRAEARYKAACIYLGVVTRIALLVTVLLIRAWFMPELISRLFLNMSGIWDEVASILFLVYWIGPHDVMYSCCHLYEVWLELWAWLKPLIRLKHE